MLDEVTTDRALGALIGLAVGDALGTTLEFSPRGGPEVPHTEMVGGGPFRLQPGQWTDDTAMALALADSLLACDGLVPRDALRLFDDWFVNGTYSCTGKCFDIGGVTSAALWRFRDYGIDYPGSHDSYTAGNGSVMRLAPAVLFGLRDAAATDRLARDQGRLTHGASAAVDGCSLLATVMREAILGMPDPLRPRDWNGDPDIARIAAGSWKGKAREDVRAGGYVVHTLDAALWAVDGASSFEEALVRAVNLGEDADTVGAVTGQIAGALYGLSSIPERWLVNLAWRERIEDTGRRLLAARAMAKPPVPA